MEPGRPRPLMTNRFETAEAEAERRNVERMYADLDRRMTVERFAENKRRMVMSNITASGSWASFTQRAIL